MPAKHSTFTDYPKMVIAMLLIGAIFSMVSLGLVTKSTMALSRGLAVDLSTVKSLFSQQTIILSTAGNQQSNAGLEVQTTSFTNSSSEELTVTNGVQAWDKVKIKVVKLSVNASVHVVSAPASYSLYISGSDFSLEQAALRSPVREQEVRSHVTTRDYLSHTIVQSAGGVYEQSSLDNSYQSSECLRVPSVRVLLC